MKFYFADRIGGTPREMTMDEVHQHLSEGQIREAIEAKQADPNEDEMFRRCEVFTTVKGNQFIYWRDEEIDADYITKVPKEEQK